MHMHANGYEHAICTTDVIRKSTNVDTDCLDAPSHQRKILICANAAILDKNIVVKNAFYTKLEETSKLFAILIRKSNKVDLTYITSKILEIHKGT